MSEIEAKGKVESLLAHAEKKLAALEEKVAEKEKQLAEWTSALETLQATHKQVDASLASIRKRFE